MPLGTAKLAQQLSLVVPHVVVLGMLGEQLAAELELPELPVLELHATTPATMNSQDRIMFGP